jgi:hypothetical protein
MAHLRSAGGSWFGSPESCVREYGSVPLMRRYRFDEDTMTERKPPGTSWET